MKQKQNGFENFIICFNEHGFIPGLLCAAFVQLSFELQSSLHNNATAYNISGDIFWCVAR